MSDIPVSRVAVVGTGVIGAPVARNLARKGFAVRAWNRTASKARSLVDDGVEAFDRLEDAVREADILVTVLKDGDAVEQAMSAALPHVAAGTVWLQLGTVGIEATARHVALAADHGLVFYDAPVQGTRQPAEQGKLTVLASGPASARPAVQSVFDAIGQRTIWLSERPGDSTRLKLALNSFVFALTHGTAEALRIADALGIEPSRVVEAITGSPLDGGYFQAKAAAMLRGDYTPSFSIGNGLKDADLVTAALRDLGVRADLAEAGRARFRRAAEAGHGGKDISASFLA